jgi:hypothetical protein
MEPVPLSRVVGEGSMEPVLKPRVVVNSDGTAEASEAVRGGDRTPS